MLRTNLPRAIRHLRRHRRWRQADLAAKSGVSRPTISRIERGRIQAVPLRTLSALTDALGATVDVYLRWEGEQIDRLVDAAHASAQELTARHLRARGWSVKAEVSFNHYGDRGRVDLLAFSPPPNAFLLVVEVKSGIGDIQETLGRLDVKARLARRLAADAGWPEPRAVVPALVLLESGAARRVVAAHPALFAPFSFRGRAAQAWTRRPSTPAPSGLLWYVNSPRVHHVNRNRRGRVRIHPNDG